MFLDYLFEYRLEFFGGMFLNYIFEYRTGWPSGHHQGAGCRVGARILTYTAFC